MAWEPGVSIVIPVFNEVSLTIKLLNGLRYFTSSYTGVEIIISDDGSTDATVLIPKQFPDVGYVRSPRNFGFARACNVGACVARGDVLVFLNNDVNVHGDFVRSILRGLKVFDVVGPDVVDYDGDWNRFGDVVIPYVYAWCLAVRREVFFDIGGFDERFLPFDYEDVDFCYAAVQKGYRLGKVDLPLEHIGGQTIVEAQSRLDVTRRNRKKFAEKWGLPC